MSLFAQYLTAFTGSLKEIVPSWRSRRPGKENGWKWEWSMTLPLDILAEVLLQGINDWAPGSPNATPTALPLIGQTRGLIQGQAETDDAYAARLRNWIGPFPFTSDIWSNMGKTAQLAHAIRIFLANNPTVRVIERVYSDSGSPTALWVTANPDGTTTEQLAAWDWDSVGGWTDPTTTYPGDTTRGFWSDYWIVVQPPEWAVQGSNSWDGQAVSLEEVDTIRSLLGEYKGAHTFCRAIVWNYHGAGKFEPGNPTADGSYGNWGKLDASGNVIAARDASARYWIPAEG
jgi:hypothetical protein